MPSFRDELRKRGDSVKKTREKPAEKTAGRSSRRAAESQTSRREESSRRDSRASSRTDSESRRDTRASARTSSRKSSREALVIEDPEDNTISSRSRGRERNARGNKNGKKDNTKLMLYGGVGAVALLLIIGLVVMQLTSGGGKSRKKVKADIEEEEVVHTIEPYASPEEAEKMLIKADNLFAQGRASNDNSERNKCYKECLVISQRVRETDGISGRTGERASKLCYDAGKCQTYK
jgi:hypothetical protein